MKVKDLSSENKVDGEGIVLWPVKDTNGETHIIELPGLHIPKAGVRLLSPQVLKQLHGVGGSIDELGISLHGDNNVSIFVPYNPVSNLPELELCPYYLPTARCGTVHSLTSTLTLSSLITNLSLCLMIPIETSSNPRKNLYSGTIVSLTSIS
jgi:hypothetical protein